MLTLIKISWRNIWRNTRRSGVLIIAVAVGVFVFLGSMTFIDGMSIQMVNNAIDLGGGHLQVSRAGYQENPTVRSYISDSAPIEAALDRLPEAKYSGQVLAQGMINSAEQASGIQITGIRPDQERDMTSVAASVIEGRYLNNEDADGSILIGAELAEQLNLRLDEKVVLRTSNIDNELQAGAYRIVGLFRTANPVYDKANVLLPIDEVRRLAGYPAEAISAYTIRLDAGADLELNQSTLKEAINQNDIEVINWRERNPMLVFMREMYDISIVAFVVIMFTAIAFTIINTYLMVIYERIREIGIMMANGVKPMQIRIMLFLEALFTFAIGAGIGLLLGGAFFMWMSGGGLDLSEFADGIGKMGAGTVIYPHLDPAHMQTGFTTIFIIVVLAVLYPAWKASRFEPVDAIRHT